jgi:GT2 family glycosyltransferase
MRADRQVGIMVPRIAYFDDPETLWYGGGDVEWRRASAFTPGINRSASAALALSERDVSFATGCALFARASVFRQLGGFDPRFFMYEEDLELCLRAREKGIRIRYIPRSLVLHRVQGSSRGAANDRRDFWSVDNPRLTFYAYHVIHNRLLNADLHARGKQRLTVIVFFPLFLIRRAIPFLVGGRVDAVWAMFRGITDFWRTRRKNRAAELPVRST